MHPVSITDLPQPPAGKTGWPWTEATPPLPAQRPEGGSWPRISVTTPSYNQGQFLEETIRSVLLQGYPNLEYIVMDGGSTDGSQAIIQRYAPWLAAWASEKDRGQSHAINKGWERSTGDWICYLNSDDFFLPGALAAVAEVAARPGAAVIAGGIRFVNADSSLAQERAPFLRAAAPLDLSILDPRAWYIPQQSSFFARPALDQAGRFLREDLHYTMDRELMYRLCRLGEVRLLPQALAADRKHGESKRIAATMALYREDERALAYCDWGDDRARALRKQVARARLAQGHLRYASHAPTRLAAIRHTLAAGLVTPRLLARRSYYRTLFKAITGPLEG